MKQKTKDKVRSDEAGLSQTFEDVVKELAAELPDDINI